MQESLLASPVTKDPLFRSIEETHEKVRKRYGVILDAGTGGHSLKWLSSLPAVDRIVAVSADLSAGEGKGARELRSILRTDRGDALVEGSWCVGQEPKVGPGKCCDTILCDYLIGSMDGFTPFAQDMIFGELATKLKTGGLLHVVGLGPVYARLGTKGYFGLTEEQKLVVDVARTRDACILLAGHRTYREYPVDWVARQLTRSGFELLDEPKQFGVLWKHATIKTQLNVARRKLDLFRDEALATAMRNKLDTLDDKAKRLLGDTGVSYGHDYVLSATLRDDNDEETTIAPEDGLQEEEKKN